MQYTPFHAVSKICACVAGLVGTAVAGDAPTVRLVQYQVGAALSDKVPFQVKPMNHSYGAKLDLLIEGEDMVSVADDSLEITAMTGSDGSELIPARGRDSAWEQGPFPKVSEDGTVGSFQIELKGDLMGRLEGSAIEGKITLRTGSETAEKTAKLTVGGDEQEIGPFKVSAKSGEGFGGRKSLSVKVVGDYQSIVDVSVASDGKKFDSRGTSWSGNQKTFSFDASEAKEIQLTLSYWTDLESNDVAFKVVVGK